MSTLLTMTHFGLENFANHDHTFAQSLNGKDAHLDQPVNGVALQSMALNQDNSIQSMPLQ